METSTKHKDNLSPPSLLPSPKSYSPNSSTSSSNSNGNHNNNNNSAAAAAAGPSTPKPITRSESANPYPTTFVQADTSSFKQVVQMLTGSSETAKLASKPASQPDSAAAATKTHNIPPIKSAPKKPQQSGFKLYERRNSLKNLKINPLNPNPFITSGFSPRKPEILSPSILDFPSLVLSPVTPLIPDPFIRSGPANYNNKYKNCSQGNNGNFNREAEEKAIKEKGFYLHPSPSTTPREAEPRLLPLFPVTSPRVSGASASNS